MKVEEFYVLKARCFLPTDEERSETIRDIYVDLPIPIPEHISRIVTFRFCLCKVYLEGGITDCFWKYIPVPRGTVVEEYFKKEIK